MNAFWLEWADAQDRVDDYSDIDIWLDVEDWKESQIFNEIEVILSKLWIIDFAYEKEHPHPKIRQKFFHIKDTPEFLIIDACIQSHSRVFWYTDGYADEKIKMIFDKWNTVIFKPFDKQGFESDISMKIDELSKTFVFFQAWVKKSIKRNNFLEALWSYHAKVLNPLVEILRIKFEPTKSEFYLKDISRDIPENYLKALEELYKITSIEDIESKSIKAKELFFEILKTLQ